MIAALLTFAAISSGPSSQETAHNPINAPPVRADHLSVHVADPATSIAFYRDLIGLREVPSPVSSVRWLEAGNGFQVHLVPRRRAPVADTRPTHLAFSVAGFDDLLATLRAHGSSWWNFAGAEGEISRRPDGVRQIYVKDPDGYWVELNDGQAPCTEAEACRRQ